MRAVIAFLLLIPGIPGLAPGVSGDLVAQAVPRSDTPRRGAARLTADWRMELWDHDLRSGQRFALGAPLTGDTVGGSAIPLVARLEQDVRAVGGVPGYVASLGAGRLSVQQDRRTFDFTLDYGITDRLAVGVTVPVVRVHTRAQVTMDTTGTSLGLNPLILDPRLDTAYVGFFGELDAALAQLDSSIVRGTCAPRCAEAQALSTDGHATGDALRRSVYGAGSAGGAPFLPRAGSDGGRGLDSSIAKLQQDLGTFGITSFMRAFLLPADPIGDAGFEAALSDRTYGFGAAPIRNTPRSLRYWLGDVELEATYRFAAGPTYAGAAALVLRLPTGRADTSYDFLDLSAGDDQTDIELRLVQELTVARRLWLNLSVRAAIQQAGTRERRVAPQAAFLVPAGATTTLDWDPGDYLAIDFAPLYRFTREFAAGVTLGYRTRGRDRYTFAATQDSSDLAARLGEPTPASLLDQGTATQRLRVGGAVTYVGPWLESDLSIERTVSAPAGSGPVPDATVFRVVLRASRKLF
ncbi:MAG: hypothetical protein ACREMR_01800 [Gemmatimonadales bacterium]